MPTIEMAQYQNVVLILLPNERIFEKVITFDRIVCLFHIKLLILRSRSLIWPRESHTCKSLSFPPIFPQLSMKKNFAKCRQHGNSVLERWSPRNSFACGARRTHARVHSRGKMRWRRQVHFFYENLKSYMMTNLSQTVIWNNRAYMKLNINTIWISISFKAYGQVDNALSSSDAVDYVQLFWAIEFLSHVEVASLENCATWERENVCKTFDIF
jgi:hypothetical protein